MSVSSDKVRQLWLPFLILAVLILAISWVLTGVIYPNDIRGQEGNLPLATRETPTLEATPAPTSALATTLAVNANPTQATGTANLLNCTYTRYYWREHPGSWLIENVVVASLTFTKSEAIDILSEDGGAERTRLLQEFFAALLNTLKGADATVIEPVLIQGSDWLNAHPAGAEISEAERDLALDLILVLGGYNNGEIGPGHCQDEPPTPTSPPSPTPTPTETPLPTPLTTFKPSSTATLLPTAGGGGGGGNPPTQTPAPTDTSPPAPTTEPPPPTEPLPPTPTLPPDTPSP